MGNIIQFKVKENPEKKQYLGTVMMPLRKNISTVKEGYTLVRCPECGQECWKSDDMNEQLMRWDFNALCTECAIKEEFNQK